VLEVGVAVLEIVLVAMHKHALLILLLTSPVHAAAAYDGMATEAVVKVAQNACASANFVGARSARRQLSALHDAATEVAEMKSGKRREVREGIMKSSDACLFTKWISRFLGTKTALILDFPHLMLQPSSSSLGLLSSTSLLQLNPMRPIPVPKCRYKIAAGTDYRGSTFIRTRDRCTCAAHWLSADRGSWRLAEGEGGYKHVHPHLWMDKEDGR